MDIIALESITMKPVRLTSKPFGGTSQLPARSPRTPHSAESLGCLSQAAPPARSPDHELPELGGPGRQSISCTHAWSGGWRMFNEPGRLDAAATAPRTACGHVRARAVRQARRPEGGGEEAAGHRALGWLPACRSGWPPLAGGGSQRAGFLPLQRVWCGGHTTRQRPSERSLPFALPAKCSGSIQGRQPWSHGHLRPKGFLPWRLSCAFKRLAVSLALTH